MFDKIIVQPIFNLLEFIYAVVPGHDFGVAIIIFTIIVRSALWPLAKKQLHQTKKMRVLQPKLKEVKMSAGGDRQKEARLQMELYKEHGIKPFATIGTLIFQIPIFIALYQSIIRIVNDDNVLFDFAYDWVHNLPWIQTIQQDISKFSYDFLGLVDLSQKAIGGASGLYIPALILAILGAIVQFYQSKMMLPDQKDSMKLGEIMKMAAEGKQPDQADVGAAISRKMIYFLPFITFVFSATLPSALALYILVTSAVGWAQQIVIFRQDQEEMHELAIEPDKKVEKEPKKVKLNKPKKAVKVKKRRK